MRCQAKRCFIIPQYFRGIIQQDAGRRVLDGNSQVYRRAELLSTSAVPIILRTSS